MKSLLVLLTLVLTQTAFAVTQEELHVSDSCLKKIEQAVYEKLGKDDETFSVVGVKILYGGSKGGLAFSPVALVRTSDEVEPRDVLVLTNWTRSRSGNEISCKVTQVVTVADGLTIDQPEFGD